jgi:hypothetical protein
MNSVCKINSVHDIDYDAHKSNIKKELEETKAKWVKLNNLNDYYKSEDINSYKISNSITDEMVKHSDTIIRLKKELECDHEGVRFHENIGHDSHKEYYKTYCTHCGSIFETYYV